MTWRVVQLNDVPPTSWRNGGGTTRELMAWPEAAAWRWRASVAEVANSGPFSSFGGTQRWFAVLDGDGVCLTVDGHLHMLSESDQPLSFDGAAIATCELLGGATQDFNLMVRGGSAARMLRLSSNFKMTANTPKIIAVYAHKERTVVRIGSENHVLSPHSFGWTCVDANTTIEVPASSALLMEIDL